MRCVMMNSGCVQKRARCLAQRWYTVHPHFVEDAVACNLVDIRVIGWHNCTRFVEVEQHRQERPSQRQGLHRQTGRHRHLGLPQLDWVDVADDSSATSLLDEAASADEDGWLNWRRSTRNLLWDRATLRGKTVQNTIKTTEFNSKSI